MMKIALLVGVLFGLGHLAFASQPEQARPADHPGRPASSTDVPGPLVLLESVAEDIGDEAAKGNWSKAATLVDKASKNLSAVGPRVNNAIVERARGHLAEAKKAIEGRRSLEAQLAANELSADVVEIFNGYHPIVPVDVMRLDVLLRRVQLEGLANAPERATAPLDQARATWTRLRAQPLLRETPAARSFEHQLRQVEKAASRGDPKSLAQTAEAALEGVDALEHVFESAHRSE